MSLPQELAGCVVLVTSDRRSRDLRSALERRGASVVHAPAVSITAHAADAELLRATRRLLDDPPDVVIATTVLGFRGWIEAADAAGLGEDLHALLTGCRILARGPKVLGAVLAAGHAVDWVAASQTSAELRQHLLDEGVAGQHIAVQHHGSGSDALDAALVAAGATLTSLVAYRCGPPPDPAAVTRSVEEVATGAIDAVVFTSAPAATAWLDAANRAGVLPSVMNRAASGRLLVAAVGPAAARPLRAVRIEPLLPERPRQGSLVHALVSHYDTLGDDALETVAGPLQLRSSTAVLSGRAIALSPGGLAALRLLVAAGGDIVSRADLLEVLPGDSANGHAVEVTVARLREAIGDRQLVETVVKRGYRLALAPG